MQSHTTSQIAAEVRACVARRAYTQAQVAASLTITQVSISRKLSGKTPFTASELVELAALFGVPIETFFQSTAAQAVA